MLYQVEQRGRQTAFVGEDGAGLVGLYPLLARAAAIAENENSSFAEALSLAAAERGTPLRRVFADEAEALSHDLGHGGAAEQRAVIDLDNGRIRLEYDHRAGSLRESLDALANHFPTAGANRIQNRLIAFSSRFLLAMMNGFLSGSVALCCCMGSQPAPETNQKSEERSSTNESQTSM